MTSACAALGLALALTGGRAAARVADGQQPVPPPAFHATVNQVTVDAVVTDAGGHLVRGLGQHDFEIFENGRRQDVSTFALVDIPSGTSAAGPVSSAPLGPEPDVHDNGAGEPAPRVYVIVLDDLHVRPVHLQRAKEIATRFIERHLAPSDLAAVIHTSGRVEVGQGLTTNRHFLLRAVDRFQGQGMRSSMLDRLESLQGREARPGDRADMRMNQVTDPQSMIRADHARRLLTVLTNIGHFLEAVPARRKALILISEGLGYDLLPESVQTSSGLTTLTGGAFPDVLTEFRQAVRAAARGNVAVYGIDPRGIAAPGEDTMAVTSFPENPLLGITPGAFQREVRRAQDSLRTLSDVTGGAALVDSNDFAPLLARIVAESSTYYVLGYRSNADGTDGRYRSIEVRVKRPGVHVRARRGYMPGPAPPAPPLLSETIEPSARLREGLNSILPIPDVPLRLFPIPFKGDAKASVVVGIEVDAKAFAFQERNGLFTDRLEVAIVALDQQGTLTAGDRYTVDLSLKPGTHAAVRANGLRVVFRLPLAAGRFQLRAAVHETGRDAIGSVTYDLDVPDLDASGLQMSGLVITMPRARLRPTARPDPGLSRALQSPPTGTRVFGSDESIMVFFEMYGAGSPAGVDIATSIQGPDGAVAISNRAHASAAELAKAGGRLGIALPISLAPLADGPHVLRVALRPTGATTDAIVRELPIAVVARHASTKR